MLDTFVDQKNVTLLLEPGATPDLISIEASLAAEKLEVESVNTVREQPF